MKKILLTLILITSFTLPTFSEEQGMPTIEFAKQCGELIGKAKVCGVDTMNVNQKIIEGINVLATYRKETPDNAVSTYKSSIQQYLRSTISDYDCEQVRSDFAQVEAQLNKQAN